MTVALKSHSQCEEGHATTLLARLPPNLDITSTPGLEYLASDKVMKFVGKKCAKLIERVGTICHVLWTRKIEAPQRYFAFGTRDLAYDEFVMVFKST